MSGILTQFAQTGHEPRALGNTGKVVGWAAPNADARRPLCLSVQPRLPAAETLQADSG